MKHRITPDGLEIVSEEGKHTRVLIEDDVAHIRPTHTVDDLVDENKELQTLQPTHSRGTQDHWRHVARIPEPLLYQKMVDFGGLPQDSPECQRRWRQWLNDGAQRDLRIWSGKL